ncbi:MAG: hypothetical protein LAP85_28255 [Acidobacteriia bacterium]|nr:hypothetical protein [Terriglobia bacterium]
MALDYVLLGILWALYCGIHSALISISVTRWSKAALADGYRYYRLLFNVFSLATLVPLIMYSNAARFSSPPLFDWGGYWQILRYSLVSLAIVLIVAGARHYSLLQFLGILQVRKGSKSSAMTGSGNLDQTGVLGIVRHPWYVAVFILLWASDLNKAAIIVNSVLSGYLFIGTLLEERKLVIEFGQQYKDYQDQVSMFFPLKWLTARWFV